jgi:hypothetical protein
MQLILIFSPKKNSHKTKIGRVGQWRRGVVVDAENREKWGETENWGGNAEMPNWGNETKDRHFLSLNLSFSIFFLKKKTKKKFHVEKKTEEGWKKVLCIAFLIEQIMFK